MASPLLFAEIAQLILSGIKRAPDTKFVFQLPLICTGFSLWLGI
jgi:hypothetical protein